MKYVVRMLGIILIAEALLLLSGSISISTAAPLIVITEATALFLGGTLVLSLVKKIRADIKKGERLYVALGEALEGALPPKVLFLVKHEIGIFASLARFITRRKDIPEGAREITYGKQIRQLIFVLAAVSIVEIIAIELLIPWTLLRIILLVLSIYGLMWILGFLCATVVYPHYVTNEKLVVRFMHYQTLAVPLDAITDIHLTNKAATKNKTLVLEDNFISLNVLGGTNITLSLVAGSIALHNNEPLRNQATRFSFFVDDQSLARSSILKKLKHTL